jgi:hypothetical protein
MPRATPLLAGFNGGEVSGLLGARADLQWYYTACRVLRNFVPLVQGPATRRPGFRFIAANKTQATRGRLAPFQFNVEQSYVVAFEHLVARFYMNRGRIEQPAGTPVEIATPYTADDLVDLKWTQSADTLFLVHPRYAPRKLTRTSHTVWTLSVVAFTNPPADWSDVNGWPTCICFHDERLWFAGAAAAPQRINATQSGNFTSFTVAAPPTDADAVDVTIAANAVNRTRWMMSSRRLLVGTVGQEFAIGPDRDDAAITPNNIQAKKQTSYGVASVQPVEAGESVLWLQRQGRKLREMAYDVNKDGYVSPDMTRRAPHLSRGGYVEFAYQQEPWSVIWIVRTDGTLVGFTYLRDEAVTAWHRHDIGGAGIAESVACIPGTVGTGDQLWCIVRRTINGATTRYVECMDEAFDDLTLIEDACFMDSALSYSGAPVTVLTGLGHLEGKTVEVLGDGARQNRKTVVAGSITLDSPVTKATVGLPYESDLQPVRLEAGSTQGSAQGRQKRIDTLMVRVERTLALQAGRDAAHLELLPGRSNRNDVGVRLDPYTGDLTYSFPGDWDTDASIYLRCDGPFPATILGLMPRMNVSEDRG